MIRRGINSKSLKSVAIFLAFITTACLPPPQDIIAGILNFGTQLFGIPAEITGNNVNAFLDALLKGEELDPEDFQNLIDIPIDEVPEEIIDAAQDVVDAAVPPGTVNLRDLIPSDFGGKMAGIAGRRAEALSELEKHLNTSVYYQQCPAVDLSDLSFIPLAGTLTVDFGADCAGNSGSMVMIIGESGITFDFNGLLVNGVGLDGSMDFLTPDPNSLIIDGNVQLTVGAQTLNIAANQALASFEVDQQAGTSTLTLDGSFSITDDADNVLADLDYTNFTIQETEVTLTNTELLVNGEAVLSDSMGGTIEIDARDLLIAIDVMGDTTLFTVEDNGQPDVNGVASTLAIRRGDTQALYSLTNYSVRETVTQAGTETVINGSGMVAHLGIGVTSFEISDVTFDPDIPCEFPTSGSVSLTSGGDNALLEYTSTCGIADRTLNGETTQIEL